MELGITVVDSALARSAIGPGQADHLIGMSRPHAQVATMASLVRPSFHGARRPSHGSAPFAAAWFYAIFQVGRCWKGLTASLPQLRRAARTPARFLEVHCNPGHRRKVNENYAQQPRAANSLVPQCDTWLDRALHIVATCA